MAPVLCPCALSGAMVHPVKLFLPQNQLEEWALADKADIQEGKLLIAEEKASYPAVSAVHFIKIVSGKDEKKLVSRVKTQAQLDEIGAEAMADSVILGDSAYEVVPGYVTEVPTPKLDKKKGNPEADLLAAFILDKL